MTKMSLSGLRKDEFFVECRFTTTSLTFPSSESDWHEPVLGIEKLQKVHGILWVMTKSHDTSDTGNFLEAKTFFSTSEYAQIPPYASALFSPLMEEPRSAWTQTFESAHRRLSSLRRRLLESKGQKSELIQDLLQNSLLWDEMEKICKQQISELTDFQQTFEKQTVLHENLPLPSIFQDFGNSSTRESQSPGGFSTKKSSVRDDKPEEAEKSEKKDLEAFKAEIEILDGFFDEQLAALKITSQNLIQLEFNLTSIAEAQMARSVSMSTKRLSWITFVFLPLMFVASVFGMNVDQLESNPLWWWPVVLAVATALLIFIAWGIVKYRRAMKRKFPQLVQWGSEKYNQCRSRAVENDLEEGSSPSSSPKRMTEMFSAFGKKRS
ncbi:hypothetical protein CSUB01_10418 [Colletotrichum sublineola]|uniref:CorA-like Mg2+ transporter n=1 Tax=Colletotrichum sublineola TaxID=1173701 RepID=A0A066XS01_COLSU|nr:hypothetical protein CSUB01_10418 [Colletotrichum sublineola]